jgi:transcriptional regulator with XRE-family HTH domain
MSETIESRPARKPRVIDELFRIVLGATLREMRLDRGERLDDTAGRAGISPQYLSEVERGRKDASSEMIAAVVGALDSSLADVLTRVACQLAVTGSAEVIDIHWTVSRITSAGSPQSHTTTSVQATLCAA